MGESGVGRMRDRLLLDSGIYRNPFEIFGVDRPGAVGHREALLQQRGDLLLTQPLAPARERRAIKWQLVPEHTSPQKYWKYGFSTHRSHSASSERLCICLRMNSPATSRVGNGGCPGPTRHTELKRRARKSQSISPASESRRRRNHGPPKSGIPNRKKTGMHTRLSCKIDYLLRSNHRDRSIAS